MKYIIKELDSDSVDIIPLGDFHVGDPRFDEQRFLDLRAWILKNPNVRVVGTGDWLNCALKNSKSDVYAEKLTVQQAKEKVVALLQPIKDRIDCIVEGNHERRVYKETGSDVCKDIAMYLGVEYAGEGAVLNYKFRPYETKGAINYTMYVVHGFGGGGTIGSKANVINKLDRIIDCDIYCIGHVHAMIAHSLYRYYPDIIHGTIEQKKRLYVSSSSFLQYGGYAEEMGLLPAKLGAPKIHLNGRKKNFHVSI